MPIDYKLLDQTDQWLTRPKFKAARQLTLYPSEASVEITDKDGFHRVEGGCLRQSYYRVTAEATPTPTESRGEYIMAIGKTLEQWLIERWKEMGIWVDNNVKFYWPEFNISGELDVILAEPPSGELYGVEVKTFYGYEAHKEIFGNKTVKPFPKLNQFLQTLVYTYYFRDRLKYFKMIYMDRSDTSHKEFNIEVKQLNGKWFPVVDGVPYEQFSIEDILDRYKLLNYYVNNHITPPRDYELVWDSARVEREKSLGNVSKTAYLDWKKGKRKIGDWNCRYCPFKNHCWADMADTIPVEESEVVDESEDSETTT